jgi:hypothetical protein
LSFVVGISLLTVSPVACSYGLPSILQGRQAGRCQDVLAWTQPGQD